MEHVVEPSLFWVYFYFLATSDMVVCVHQDMIFPQNTAYQASCKCLLNSDWINESFPPCSTCSQKLPPGWRNAEPTYFRVAWSLLSVVNLKDIDRGTVIVLCVLTKWNREVPAASPVGFSYSALPMFSGAFQCKLKFLFGKYMFPRHRAIDQKQAGGAAESVPVMRCWYFK